MIGSKKYPMLPMKREPVAGREIFNIFLIIFHFGSKSYFLILICFGKKQNKIMIDVISLTILDRMMKATAYSIPFIKK